MDVVLEEDTAVYRSRIAGAVTMVAQEIAVEDDGVPLLRTSGRTNCGDTAGEEHDVSMRFPCWYFSPVTRMYWHSFVK